MFGTYRVVLAVLVLLSHVSGQLYFNYGVSAVINFLMISGYVMTLLIRNNYGQMQSLLYFYADRFLRIYPQFFLFIILTQIADLQWYFTDPFLSGTPTVGKFFLNALVVPANYYMLLPDSLAHYLLIPATWSLGLEEQFYWVFPFLVLIPLLGRMTTMVSFGTYLLAVFGVLNPELFGFRFLPGIIFIFLLGKNLAEYNVTKRKENLWTMLSLYGATALLALALRIFAPEHFFAAHNKEVLLGVIIGFPIIAFLSWQPRRGWDEFLGRSSYGIFLCHVLMINIFLHFKIFLSSHRTFLMALIPTSMLLGFAGYYCVEKVVNPFRFSLRQRHASASKEVNA